LPNSISPTSFAQTIELASHTKPEVIVMDVHMREDGETPSHVKSQLEGSRIVAISLWADDETKALAEDFGAVCLLDKLYAELIPAIKALPRLP
jgi:hypothetical protein